VQRPKVLETTATGAAWLAGHRAGVYPAQREFAETWAVDSGFAPNMPSKERGQKTARWAAAVASTIGVQF
ncbi:MAG: glycerol kinase, partial [Gammaproteobacteria bacterium]|nr:glycerol kinase [Gammaproteobacteria bacterium]